MTKANLPLREGINNKRYLSVESFHEEGDPTPPPPHDLVGKTQVIVFGLRIPTFVKKVIFPP